MANFELNHLFKPSNIGLAYKEATRNFQKVLNALQNGFVVTYFSLKNFTKLKKKITFNLDKKNTNDILKLDTKIYYLLFIIYAIHQKIVFVWKALQTKQRFYFPYNRQANA